MLGQDPNYLYLGYIQMILQISTKRSWPMNIWFILVGCWPRFNFSTPWDCVHVLTSGSTPVYWSGCLSVPSFFFSFCHWLQLAHCWSTYPDRAMKRSVARPAIGTFGKNTYIVWCQVILNWFLSSSFGRKGKRFGRIFWLANILMRTG